uniref:Uncharacterized protein n=1 Tax=Zea mays TaxID=4577 RepID=C0PJG7_MAIZE|nr:unknown [Zea mays]
MHLMPSSIQIVPYSHSSFAHINMAFFLLKERYLIQTYGPGYQTHLCLSTENCLLPLSSKTWTWILRQDSQLGQLLAESSLDSLRTLHLRV